MTCTFSLHENIGIINLEKGQPGIETYRNYKPRKTTTGH